MCVGVESDDAAAYYLAPHSAIRAVSETKNCLFVFDDVLLH